MSDWPLVWDAALGKMDTDIVTVTGIDLTNSDIIHLVDVESRTWLMREVVIITCYFPAKNGTMSRHVTFGF